MGLGSMYSNKRHGQLPEQQKLTTPTDLSEAADAVGTKAAEEYRDHIGAPTPIPNSQKN